MIHLLNTEYCRWRPPADCVVELDIGCGRGGFLVQLAGRYPDRAVIGIDVMLGRVRKVAKKCKHSNVDNVSLLRCAAWPAVCCHLPDACIDRVHILCPDPWPRKKHRRHRLVTSEFLGRLALKLKPGGVLHLATDDVPYWDSMVRVVDSLGCYNPSTEGISDILDLKTDFETEYEDQGIHVNHGSWART